jgi:hypothetical protein
VAETVPSVLTSQTFELDGRTDNPLYSYSLQKELVQNVVGPNHRYSKHKGYQTVRYPLSGEYCVVLTSAPCYDLRMLIHDVYQA